MEKQMTDMSIVMAQVYCVLQYMPDEMLIKIPSQIQSNIASIKSNTYHFEYDTTKELDEQDLLEETKDMLAAIYLTYICDKSRKEEVLESCKQNDAINDVAFQEKDVYNVFDNHNEQKNIKKIESIEELDSFDETTDIVEVKENAFIKFINKIKNLFKF